MERRQHELERQQHYMRCPKCGGQLGERELFHVRVDVCTDCSGLWLDAGEVELLRATERHGLGRLMSELLRHRAK
jgi:Zn-finger nucleic acid-binding protein